ncbi:MAG: FAD-binding oxidoreductase [Dehalococcoidia bacterium]
MSEPPLVAGAAAATVHRPGSIPALQALVRDARGATLVPVGAGTQLDLGRAPVAPFELVELAEALGGPISLVEDDLTVAVPAGATLGDIEAVLAPARQRLPIDPPLAAKSTIGGVLASGLGGPLRSRFGQPKDLVLGMTVLRADGELVKAGGRVVKNVTGYDLMRLWCGSLGTLGIVTEVTLRVYPAVPVVTLTAEVASPQEGAALIDRVFRADLRPEVADILVEGGRSRVVLTVHERAVQGVRGFVSGLEESPPALLERCRDAGFDAHDVLAVRATTTPSGLATAVQRLNALRADTLVVRPLAGFVRAAWSAPGAPGTVEIARAVDALRAEVTPRGGAVIVDRMPARFRADLDPWGAPPPGFDLMRKLKAAYDPAGRFNAGRYVGGL